MSNNNTELYYVSMQSLVQFIAVENLYLCLYLHIFIMFKSLCICLHLSYSNLYALFQNLCSVLNWFLSQSNIWVIPNPAVLCLFFLFSYVHIVFGFMEAPHWWPLLPHVISDLLLLLFRWNLKHFHNEWLMLIYVLPKVKMTSYMCICDLWY